MCNPLWRSPASTMLVLVGPACHPSIHVAMCVFLIPLLSKKREKEEKKKKKNGGAVCEIPTAIMLISRCGPHNTGTKQQRKKEREREDRWEETYSSSWRWNSTIEWISHSQRAGHRSYRVSFRLCYMQRRAILCFVSFILPPPPSLIFPCLAIKTEKGNNTKKKDFKRCLSKLYTSNQKKKKKLKKEETRGIVEERDILPNE